MKIVLFIAALLAILLSLVGHPSAAFLVAGSTLLLGVVALAFSRAFLR